MDQGLTYKQQYNTLINEMKDIITSKKKSIELANKVLNDENLIIPNVEIIENLENAINENEIIINELQKILLNKNIHS